MAMQGYGQQPPQLHANVPNFFASRLLRVAADGDLTSATDPFAGSEPLIDAIVRASWLSQPSCVGSPASSFFPGFLVFRAGAALSVVRRER